MNSLLNVRETAEEIALRLGSLHLMPVISKELLHLEILETLDRLKLFRNLVFQGGTCLRLCHHAYRYSEDLDFCTSSSIDDDWLSGVRDELQRSLDKIYEVEVSVYAPKKRVYEQGDTEVIVKKWRINIDTDLGRRDIPRQRIKVEIAEVPSYSREIKRVTSRYPQLPKSYGDVLVPCESLAEICADKLVAFSMSTHLRHRDIWDLHWLSSQPELDRSLVKGMVKNKLNDYHVDVEFDKMVAARLGDLPEILSGERFAIQMQRFLEADSYKRTVERVEFHQIIEQDVRGMYALLD